MNRKIWILFIIVFIILFSNVIFSSSNPFETPRRCSDVWGGELCNSTTLDDANFGGCNGTKEPSDSTYGPHILEVYINATNFFPEAGINVTCEFKEVSSVTNYKYFWYYNSSEWISIQNFTSNPDVTQTNNTSIIFNLNSSEGIHRIRCIISKDAETTGPCSNSTYTSATQYDNDDVIFTVTSHLTYDFWNLTNYTTGEEIASNQTFTRNDSINVSAKWNKNISFAQIEHNGTGTWTNYTISSLGNWTNYTLNLSNTSEFNNTIIAIRSIYVNDTYSATNNTYPELYFYLLAGNAPNVTNFWFSYNGTTTNITNKYTNLTIHANVSDDVGLSTVKANITYPDGNSTNATMQGDTSSG